MPLHFRRFTGLQLRLCFEFGLLALAFSFFSGAVFLNAERAILQYYEERDVRERIVMLLSERSPDEYAEAARLAGIDALQWRASPDEGWQGAALDWQAGEAGVYVASTVRWYGKSPVTMQLAGTTHGYQWRAQRDMGRIATILDSTSGVISVYLFLNALVLTLVGLVWLTRRVTRPVTDLSDAIGAVRHAEDFRELPVFRSDELGDLTRSYNDLMSRIRDSEARNARTIGKLEHAYRELSAVQEQLITTEKLASLGRLSAGVAHEIGNPLSAITGYLRLLPQLDGKEAEEALEHAYREAIRIDAIIRDLLTFSRAGQGQTELIALPAFVADLVDRLATQPRFEEIRFETDAGDDVPPVQAAPGLLEQVLVNLFSNAADAMEGRGTIEVRAFAVPGQVVIAVRDSGPGIAPEELSQIFEPFYTTKASGKGTGLGLAISHQLLATMNGRLHADNHRQGGAVFRIELPPAGQESGPAPGMAI